MVRPDLVESLDTRELAAYFYDKHEGRKEVTGNHGCGILDPVSFNREALACYG